MMRAADTKTFHLTRYATPGLLLLLLTAACGTLPGRITGEPPQATIDGIQRSGNTLTVEVGLRNMNDQPIKLSEATIELFLSDTLLARARQATTMEIAARGRDLLRVHASADRAGLAQLDAITGQGSAAAWRMILTLTDRSGQQQIIENQGWLHPVPGQPDNYR